VKQTKKLQLGPIPHRAPPYEEFFLVGQSPPLPCERGEEMKGRGGERRGGREFVLCHREKREKSAPGFPALSESNPHQIVCHLSR